MPLEEHAKELIQRTLYIVISTVDSDGRPWNSPVYSAFDENYNFYWASDQNSQHSKNIAGNNKIFFVIFDSNAKEGEGFGVYFQAKAQKLENPEEIVDALKYLDGRVGKQKDPNARPMEFQGNNPRRVYKAVPEKVWVNGVGDVNGKYIDVRTEISLK